MTQSRLSLDVPEPIGKNFEALETIKDVEKAMEVLENGRVFY